MQAGSRNVHQALMFCMGHNFLMEQTARHILNVCLAESDASLETQFALWVDQRLERPSEPTAEGDANESSFTQVETDAHLKGKWDTTPAMATDACPCSAQHDTAVPRPPAAPVRRLKLNVAA